MIQTYVELMFFTFVWIKKRIVLANQPFFNTCESLALIWAASESWRC